MSGRWSACSRRLVAWEIGLLKNAVPVRVPGAESGVVSGVSFPFRRENISDWQTVPPVSTLNTPSLIAPRRRWPSSFDVRCCPQIHVLISIHLGCLKYLRTSFPRLDGGAPPLSPRRGSLRRLAAVTGETLFLLIPTPQGFTVYKKKGSIPYGNWNMRWQRGRHLCS